MENWIPLLLIPMIPTLPMLRMDEPMSFFFSGWKIDIPVISLDIFMKIVAKKNQDFMLI